MLALACALFAGVSCTPDNGGEQGGSSYTSSVAVTGAPEANLAPEAGELTLGYTITNPSLTAALSVTTEAAWVHVGEVGETSVALTYDANTESPGSPAREAVVVFAYEGAETVNVTLKQDDIDAAKKAFENVYWAICPLSNIFIHNDLPPVELMRRNALNITVGTDSLSSNDDLDMVKELYCIHENFSDVPMNEILTWACLNGARFLSKDAELGSLEKGKKPGIVRISGIDDNGFVTSASRSERVI